MNEKWTDTFSYSFNMPQWINSDWYTASIEENLKKNIFDVEYKSLKALDEEWFWVLNILSYIYVSPLLYTRYSHTYLSTNCFFLTNNIIYVSLCSFVLRDCYNMYIPVKLCATALLGSIRPSSVMHLGIVWHMHPRTCGTHRYPQAWNGQNWRELDR